MSSQGWKMLVVAGGWGAGFNGTSYIYDLPSGNLRSGTYLVP